MFPNIIYIFLFTFQVSFQLVRGGVFQEEKMTELLLEPAKYPGCSGARNLHDNISDLRAQVAANIKVCVGVEGEQPCIH